MRQISKETAIAISQSEIWKDWTDEEKVKFQLFQKKLSMPFQVFHEAIEKVLDRPVYTHEFALNWDGLIDEFRLGKPEPTIEAIMNLIPDEKRIVVKFDDDLNPKKHKGGYKNGR